MPSKKILIVEDEAIVAIDLQKSLEKLNFIVTEMVTSYSEILKSITSNKPDLIMMDINLGEDIDGISMVENIRQIKNIPVLYLTAYSDDTTMQRAFETDPIGYLIKPFKKEELKSTIMLAMYKMNRLEYTNSNPEHKYIGCGYYFDIVNKKLYYKSKFIKLGEKERKFLNLLICSTDLSVSKEDIEHRLWLDNTPSSSSLRTLVYRLKIKLGCNIIETSYLDGYRLIPVI